jgi:hypothetical protein
MGASAAFSPRDFKAWVIEETKTGQSAGTLDSPAITSNLLQLDVDSVAFPSITPNQVMDKRTSVGRVLHKDDFFQDNVMRATEVTLAGTFRNDVAMALLMQSVTGTDLNAAVGDITIAYNNTCISGNYGASEANKTFTLVLASPDTTDGYNIVLPGALCTNLVISADTGTDGGLYKFSATISTGQKPITNNSQTEDGAAYDSTGVGQISIATLTGATTVNSIASTIMNSFSLTIDSPAVYTGFQANGYAMFSRAPEVSVTADVQIKYDSVTRDILNNFNTQTVSDDAGMLTLTQATATDCSISIPSGVLTNASLTEDDIVMMDVSIKAVNIGSGNVLALDLA